MPPAAGRSGSETSDARPAGTFDALERTWPHAEQLGFSAISCFDHISARPRGRAAWDAPSLLPAIALRTERAAVCVNVSDAPLRHPFLLAGQPAVAQAASRGRLEVGFGIGAAHLAPQDYRTLGTQFPRALNDSRSSPACWKPCRRYGAGRPSPTHLRVVEDNDSGGARRDKRCRQPNRAH